MKKIISILCLLISLNLYSQESKDTVYTVRGYECSCKYHTDLADDNKVHDRSVVPAYFPGGDDEWKKFLKKNMDSKLKGRDEVQFRFEVDRDGNISDFVLLSNAPIEKFNEIKRVIGLSGKWFPAIQAGFCVKSIVRMMVAL